MSRNDMKFARVVARVNLDAGLRRETRNFTRANYSLKICTGSHARGMDGYKGTVDGFEFRDTIFQSAVVFCFARPSACLLDLWHCGVWVRNPSPTALPCHPCELFPPSFLIKRKKTPQCHKARFDAASRAGVLVVLWSSNGSRAGGYGRHGTENGSRFRSSFRNFLKRSLSKTPGDGQTP